MFRVPLLLMIASVAHAQSVAAIEPGSSLTVGGYTQFDGRLFIDDAADPHTDQFSYRSIRPELKGTVLEHYDFRVLPDFAQGKAQIEDAYVDIRYSDVVKVRFGKFKVPFGLERLQRDIATTFVERGLPSLLTPNRDVGVQVFGEAGPVEYEAGVFDTVADNASADGDTSDHKTGVARVLVHPIAGLALGAAGTYGWEQAAPVPTYTTQGGTPFFSYMDGVVSSGRHWRASAQGHYYRGPVGVLGEYVRSVEHVALGGSNDRAVFDAWQGLVQWVITGERASYASVAPAHRFDPARGGWGAFDVAVRYGELRLADSSMFDLGFADPTKSARRARSIGGGADWFLNRQIRAVFDVEHTWYWLGRAAETSVVGRVQTVF